MVGCRDTWMAVLNENADKMATRSAMISALTSKFIVMLGKNSH